MTINDDVSGLPGRVSWVLSARHAHICYSSSAGVMTFLLFAHGLSRLSTDFTGPMPMPPSFTEFARLVRGGAFPQWLRWPVDTPHQTGLFLELIG
jgi:hypothetical protein